MQIYAEEFGVDVLDMIIVHITEYQMSSVS